MHNVVVGELIMLLAQVNVGRLLDIITVGIRRRYQTDITVKYGDQFVEIMIHTPGADSDAEKAFYEDMQARFDFNPRSF